MAQGKLARKPKPGDKVPLCGDNYFIDSNHIANVRF